MSRQLSGWQASVLDDLLREKTLWAVFRQSCRIPFSKTNICVGILSGVVAAAFSCMTTTVSKLANELRR